MSPDFVRQFAPRLSAFLPDDNSGGGLSTQDHPYDSSGTPLPYMDQGGQRQYFGTPAGLTPEANPPADTTGTPLPYMQQGGQRQYFGTPAPIGPDGLRGTTPSPSLPGSDGLRGRNEPQNMLQDNGVPPRNPDDVRALVEGRRPYTGPRATAHIPSMEDTRVPMTQRGTEDLIMEGVRTGNIRPDSTLADLLSHFNFQLPAMPMKSSDTGSKEPGRTVINDLSPVPDFSTSNGLADFNRRMGLSLGPQVRSQREQAALRNRGLTATEVSWHTFGRAADIPPRQINGLTGQAAINEVRRRASAAGYDVSRMEFVWEDGRGRHQGTGPHVHMEPIGHPTR